MLMKLNLQRFAETTPDASSKVTLAKGTYVWNESIETSNSYNININFKCDNVNYINMKTYTEGGDTWLLDYRTANSSVNVAGVTQSTYTEPATFINDKYRTIEVLEDTEVDNDVYSWFIANTTKQGGTDMPTDTKLSELVINYLTEEQLKTATINENEIYLTDDDTVIPTKTSELENDSGYVTETQLNAKQDKLTTTQMNAVNSGITSSKVSTYDGYSTSKQNALSTTQLNACNSGITSAKVSTYDGYSTSKQNTLNSTQLNAVNSGVTSAKVTTYDGYGTKITTLETNVANKQNKLTAGYGIGITDDGTISVTIPDGTSKGY